MEKFCSLYSSSSGNCTFIGCDGEGILIDAGVSAKKIEEALRYIGSGIECIRAIFVTHEHSDHINGIRVLASKHGIKVFASKGTLDGMNEREIFKSKIDAYIMPAEGTEICGMYVRPFRISHDAYEPTGFTVVTPAGKRAAIATDMGIITEEAANALYGSDLVLLESNHDINMLKMGPYPYPLKQRILSDVGHLSNDVCSGFAVELAKSGTKQFILGHLSKENNHPSLAYETTRLALTQAGFEENTDYRLTVAGDLNEPVLL
jgi:phosphoribosyl 1,2-cyclic phosphodiesterase